MWNDDYYKTNIYKKLKNVGWKQKKFLEDFEKRLVEREKQKKILKEFEKHCVEELEEQKHVLEKREKKEKWQILKQNKKF